ncbi:MAG: T9SS C-terminal target domain-containing protein [Ignavibacteriae bacterium]|nr:MAG: T9SS C-terminal target domain-containing protein [Ignavibacteriota bacterium]
MKNIKSIFKNLTAVFLLAVFIAAALNDNVIIQQVNLDANNIKAYFYNTGIFDKDANLANHPGFEWPKGTDQYAIFTAGLSCGAYIQDSLKEFMCSYMGELAPGYIMDSTGTPIAKTDYRFKIWKVSRTDNHINNPDWLNWGLMVTYGAPYTDVNQNNIYEPLIDTPGVKNASQTLFACLTDGFPEEHKVGEGFGGGTSPMFAEIRLTAWAYDIPGLQDIQYMKWQVINKNKYLWDSTFFAITSDPDLGSANDDYVGCDTIRRLGFCYNGDNNDEGSYSYGINPPAVGFKLIRSVKSNYGQYLGMTSYSHFTSTNTPGAACEKDPNGEPLPAYNLMRGMKKDRTPWVIPPGGNASYVTKFCYSGDPETGLGWNEGIPGSPSGSVQNCGGDTSYTGYIVTVNPMGDRRIILSSGANNLKINPGDTQIIVAAQLIARGTSNLNSVTKLKQLSDIAQFYYDSGYVMSVNNITNEIPREYKLFQNYPNPFNPSTKIKFSVMSNVKREKSNVKLIIYDVLGKEIATLVNEELKPGTYEAEWDASQFASGIYFYSLLTNGVPVETKRMVLLK